MPAPPHGLPDRSYEAGDILIAPALCEDGGFQLSRVSANGRSSHVMSVQRTQAAALLAAARATSGSQRVFLLQGDSVADYRIVAE